MADEKTEQTTGVPAPPPEDFNEYEVWKRARDAGESDSDESEAPAAKPEAESGEEADASHESPERDEDEEEPGDGEKRDKDAPRRKSGYQRRIDKLTREKRELEARLAALEQRVAGGDKKPAGEAAETKPEAKAPAGDGRPNPEDFDTYEAYTEALVDWKTEQAERRRAAEAAERRTFEAWTARLEAARQAHDDFDEVVDSELPLSDAMFQAIVESEQGAELAYYLGSHPEEAERIAKLSPVAAIRALGRIEASLDQSHTAPKPKPAVSSAPKPAPRVSGGKAGSTPSVYDASVAEDYNAWERARRAELRRNAR